VAERNKTVFVAAAVAAAVKNDWPGFADSGDRYAEEGAWGGWRAGGKLKKSLSAEDI